MVSEYYKTLIHALKLERNTIDKRIKTLEEWVNGRPLETEPKPNPLMNDLRKRGRPKKEKDLVPYRGKGAYNGTHWMQKPENRAKMLKAIKKLQKVNKENRK